MYLLVITRVYKNDLKTPVEWNGIQDTTAIKKIEAQFQLYQAIRQLEERELEKKECWNSSGISWDLIVSQGELKSKWYVVPLLGEILF